MDLQNVLHQWLPLVSTQTAAEIDAEIREELEFHLAMRTQDNVRLGMSPEEARRDARQRFGDFEASRRACRQITLGPRLILRRLQIGLFAALIGVVIYEGVLLARLHTTSRDQIAALTHMVEQLQAGLAPLRDEAAVIPYVQWNLVLPRESVAVAGDELAGWTAAGDPLGQPWSDWRPLEAEAK